MSKDNTFFNDLSRLFGSAMDTAFNSAADMRAQFDHIVQQKMQELLKAQQLVTREEFEVVKAMAEKARLEQTALAKRLAELEGKKKKTPKVEH